MKKVSTELAIIKPIKPPANLKILGNRLAKATTPEEVLAFDADCAGFEAYMRKAGFDQGDLHLINENRMRARWRLGQMLAAVEKQKGGRGKTSQAGKSFGELLKRLKLDKNRAQEAQRISCLPKQERERVFQRARQIGELVTITWLIDEARPYWYKASRQEKHKGIAKAAQDAAVEGKVGPFPLLYMDPPWKFEIYSEKGLERTPDQHYPTLTDDEIINFTIGDTSMQELSCDDAACLMWCTSSNQKRATAVLEAIGFEFKTAAIWDKEITGLGLVFRNQHEVLLYGTRGKMPGPQYQPPSVFRYPRGKHSAKPSEIRKEIEKMYPDFDAATRCELFCREQVDGWTTFGFESRVDVAAE